MNPLLYVLVGGGIWMLPLPAGWRFDGASSTLRRCQALGGAVAAITLAALDPDDPLFAGVAQRAAVFWTLGAVIFVVCSRFGVQAVERLGWLPALGGIALQLTALAGASAADRITISMPVLGRLLVTDVARAGILLTSATLVARLGFVLSERLRARVLRPLIGVAATWTVSITISLAAKDLGGAAVSGLTFAVLAFLVLNTLRPTALLLAIGANGLVAGCLLLPHALHRLQIFLSPPTSSELEQTQLALFASSSGGLTGHPDGGTGLTYLGSTLDDDFLLAAVGRVLGLAGILAVLLVVFTAAYVCVMIASRGGRSDTRAWIASGLGVLIPAQAMLAIGGVLGVVPETGVPIPLVTGSGTSLLVTSALVGLAANSQKGLSTT